MLLRSGLVLDRQTVIIQTHAVDGDLGHFALELLCNLDREPLGQMPSVFRGRTLLRVRLLR